MEDRRRSLWRGWRPFYGRPAADGNSYLAPAASDIPSTSIMAPTPAVAHYGAAGRGRFFTRRTGCGTTGALARCTWPLPAACPHTSCLVAAPHSPTCLRHMLVRMTVPVAFIYIISNAPQLLADSAILCRRPSDGSTTFSRER